ncbi:uncharacterized protein PGTG_17552 [Puccinia graminis f. sp. tritici CRL 75-36-700-3]|uniref:Uncharacterized protein n=1 Tax=Puccinia graminis f. sp. tritici (strain CRL 75-36-700-3 / race SCCL) TaxID=418459 RepID=E3L571_PUCGT|nr:uncharacterized protein PGTG_17552 [Puccinia graminis f. sp. tritici CRL 75-36-700-3]EFP91696.2 hypothetical protein PGTG_17552 [Puccinia graminis f. sp. tritici CRL 75-36-700-3]
MRTVWSTKHRKYIMWASSTEIEASLLKSTPKKIQDAVFRLKCILLASSMRISELRWTVVDEVHVIGYLKGFVMSK